MSTAIKSRPSFAPIYFWLQLTVMADSNHERRDTIRVEDHLGLVGSIVLKFVRKGEVEDSELYSVGCLALVEAAKTHDPSKSKFSTWAYRVVRNRVLDEFKKSRRSRESSSCNLSMLADDFRESFPVHMVSDMIGGEERDDFTKMLVEHYIEGKSLAEIGREFGISREWVRKKVQFALSRIRSKNLHVLENQV